MPRRGMRLKLMRIARGVSQKELAARSGIPLRTVQNWEANGTRNAAAGPLKRVADTLGCTVDELIDKEESDA